ncbi:MAG TPA: ABC transporter permease [Candidatus Binataceae bacterium]|nr:ABC transporter permease [Candidatus Binataceae bacterium]
MLLQVYTLWKREVVRFCRQRSRVTGAFLQPLVFWALLGVGFNASFRPAGTPATVSYAEYFYPGVIALVLLFTAIFATISTIDDRKQGFLQGVLVAPITRTTVVMSQALGGTTLALVQGIIFLVLAPIAGVRLSVSAVLATVIIMGLVAFALTNLGLIIAWRIDSTQGFHAIMNLILLPIWMLSGAFFPAAGAPGWLAWVMRVNPMTYGMAALRESLYLAHPGALGSLPNLTFSALLTVAFAAVTYLGAVRVASRVVTA